MSQRPRKVLFIAGDQWRAECLSAAGHRLALTPNLDALAQEGVRFAKHFGQASPCGPARSSLLTGLYLQTHRSGRNGTPLDDRFTNLAREVRKAGLRPFLFGYTDTSADPRGRMPDDPALHSYEGVMPGFDIGCQLPEDFKPWRAYLAAKGYPVFDDVWDYFEPQGGKIGAPALYREEDSPTAFLADRIIENIKVRRDENWCFYLSILAPHPPLIASGRWNEMIQPRDVDLPQRFATWQEEQALHPFHAWRVENTFLNRKWLGKAYAGHRLNEAMVRQVRATYYALIRETDHHLGRIFQALKDSGQWDDTLIISTCDHGEMLGDHWQVGKETVFDKAFHLPLVVRNPDSQANGGRGRVVERFSESIDLLPTVLDWLDRPIPPALDGLALTPFLKGEQPERWRQSAHFEYDFRDPAQGIPEKALGISSDLCYAAALRGERWKYVHFAGLPALLFDLQNDPHEMKNLADDPTHQSVMLAMAQELLSHRMAHADRTLTSHFIDEAGLHQRHEPRY